MSAEAFDVWVETQTNNAIYELIAGEVVQAPGNAYVSMLAWYISLKIGNFALNNKLGWASVEAGGFRVYGERYAPDVAFVRYEKQRRPAREGYNPVAPDIAIEVISSNAEKEQSDLRLKISNYLLAVTIVLVVNSITEAVELHIPGNAPVVGDHTSQITFGDVLPGFTLDMQDVFDYANDRIE